MTKDTVLFLLGGFVALLPFMGFPNTWDTWLLVGAGMSVCAVGVAVRRAKRPRSAPRASMAQTIPSPSAHDRNDEYGVGA